MTKFILIFHIFYSKKMENHSNFVHGLWALSPIIYWLKSSNHQHLLFFTKKNFFNCHPTSHETMVKLGSYRVTMDYLKSEALLFKPNACGEEAVQFWSCLNRNGFDIKKCLGFFTRYRGTEIKFCVFLTIIIV